MNGLKQRIIGALVLVSLAVIFVPMIFDEPHSERQSRPVTIPEEPPFPEVDVPPEPALGGNDYGMNSEPQSTPTTDSAPGYRLIEGVEEPTTDASSAREPSAQVAEPIPRTDSSAAGSEPQPQVSQPSEPATSASSADESAEFTRSLEGAWVVQLGSFGNADNARRLRDNVRDMGYGAHLQQVERGDTTLTRVFSGPFVNKSEAEAAKKALDDAFSLNSLVTSGGK
ncbi:SPOR domain-containing protein [Marinobacter shengliensis]|uniref:SPOR domain-containing protein n=1 Tax=Marinobacter shengliensis TaxID=1389223 RepID=UPI001108592A|nr:SPOR domain-containing protein [Marinobacter shengliensis]